MAKWKTYGEVQRQVGALDSEVAGRALALFAISTLISRGRTVRDYGTLTGLSQACPLSEYGKGQVSNVAASAYLSPDEVSFLALSRFYHRDFLIDIPNVDLNAVLEIVNSVVLNGDIIFPDRHGRTLYDKFNAEFDGKRIEFLAATEADKLTIGMPNGVYQVGPFVVGPLGILASTEGRVLAPDKKVPLWHCSDPGCGMIHLVKLHDYKSKVGLADVELRKVLTDREGPGSDWERAFLFMSRVEKEGKYFDIIPVLTDCLDSYEKRLLIEAALDTQEGRQIRDVIGSRINKAAGQGSATQVAARLLDNQIVQLICTLNNNVIVRIIDRLVFSERLVIPKSEVRGVKTLIPRARSRDMDTAISSLGVRSEKREPAAFLSSIVFAAYRKSGNIDDLSWRCKTIDATTSTVLTYLAEHGPRAMITDLVVPSREIYEQVCAALSLNPDSLPDVKREDFLLWKAGFNVSRYDDYLALFRNSLTLFSDTVIALPNKANDLDREKVRSSASNVFVYAERFLEELVSFNAWYLLSDHFGLAKFEYRLKDALKSVSKACGNAVSVGDVALYWSDSGGNTLGTLLVYGRALSEKLNGLSSAEKVAIQRAEADYPHYASPRSNRFPFKHTQFWADADPKAREEYVSQFSSIVSILEKAKTAEVRNAVQHYRDKSKFPDKALLLECASLLIRALDIADISNLIPKQFWALKNTKDSFGISQWEMVDYNGRTVDITLPYAFVGLIKPAFDKAYIVEGGFLLGEGAGKLIFEHRESSRFATVWDDYRHIVAVEQVDEEVDAS